MCMLAILTTAATFVLVACGGGKQVELTEKEKNLYALGLSLADQMGPFKGQITPEELGPVKQGLLDIALESKPAVNLGEYLPRVGNLSEKMRQRHRKAYLAQAATEEGARRLPSGIVIQELRKGTGKQPAAKDSVLVRYKGTLRDGTVFEEYDQPTALNLMYSTFGFRKAIKEMREGGKARFVIPAGMGYKDKQAGTVPPNSLLIYEVELLKVEGKYVAPWKQEQATRSTESE